MNMKLLFVNPARKSSLSLTRKVRFACVLSLLATPLVLASGSAVADTITFGLIKGIKVYDYSTKVTKIYMADGATDQNVPGCNGIVTITHSAHGEQELKEMIAIVTSGYLADRKVRFASNANTCEADFVAIQDTFF